MGDDQALEVVAVPSCGTAELRAIPTDFFA